MGAVEHYLPQFLLRGFAARDVGEYRVYQFRRGRDPHVTNVRNVAGERGFYGTVADTDVEPQLAARENEYAPLVQKLRVSGAEWTDKPQIDAFVLHLLARGRHIRYSAVDVASSALAGLERSLHSLEQQEALTLKALPSNREFRALLDKVPPDKRAWAEQMVVAFVRAQVRSGAIGPLLDRAFAGLRQLNIPDMAKTAQAKALLAEPPAAQTRPALQPLAWEVRHSQTALNILGDVAMVALYSDMTELTHTLKGAGQLQALYLPISSSALLVGAVKDSPPIEVDAVNVASAELSRDFFVSATAGPRETEYQRALGRRAAVVDDITMDEWVRQASQDQS